MTIPSHQGPDVRTVLPGIRISTMAVMVPTTFMYMHAVIMHFLAEPAKEKVVEIVRNHSRMGLVRGTTGISSTAGLMEYMRDLGRPHADYWENGVFEDSVSIENKTLSLYQAVHQEAIVVVGTIDAIRAAAGILTDPDLSIKKPNAAMGLVPVG